MNNLNQVTWDQYHGFLLSYQIRYGKEAGDVTEKLEGDDKPSDYMLSRKITFLDKVTIFFAKIFCCFSCATKYLDTVFFDHTTKKDRIIIGRYKITDVNVKDRRRQERIEDAIHAVTASQVASSNSIKQLLLPAASSAPVPQSSPDPLVAHGPQSSPVPPSIPVSETAPPPLSAQPAVSAVTPTAAAPAPAPSVSAQPAAAAVVTPGAAPAPAPSSSAQPAATAVVVPAVAPAQAASTEPDRALTDVERKIAHNAGVDVVEDPLPEDCYPTTEGQRARRQLVITYNTLQSYPLKLLNAYFEKHKEAYNVVLELMRVQLTGTDGVSKPGNLLTIETLRSSLEKGHDKGWLSKVDTHILKLFIIKDVIAQKEKEKKVCEDLKEFSYNTFAAKPLPERGPAQAGAIGFRKVANNNLVCFGNEQEPLSPYLILYDALNQNPWSLKGEKSFLSENLERIYERVAFQLFNHRLSSAFTAEELAGMLTESELDLISKYDL